MQSQFIEALSTEHLRADLKGRSVRGSFVTLTSQGTKFGIQTIATVVLARLLVPADFGLVAMVTAITGLGQAFAGLGLSEATIQREEINHAQVSTLFWINVAIGLALTLAVAASAPVLVWFYRDSRLKDICFALSLTFVIGGLRVQHDALLKRQMRFVSIAIRDVTSYALAVPVAIAVAWHGGGYWALVVLPLVLNFSQMVLSWLMVRWVPSFPRRCADAGSLVAFGSNVAASHLAGTLRQTAGNILIGWWWGAGLLGLYSKAYNLLLLPLEQFSVPIGSVVVPAFSRVQSDPERFARYYLRAANLILWITGPIFGFLFVAAEPVILLVLGNQWKLAAPVFQILAISALGRPLLQFTNWVLVSRGESQRLLKLGMITLPITVGGYLAGLPFGIKGVALANALVLLAMLPWVLKFTFRGTRLTFRRLGTAVRWPILLSFGSVCVAELAIHRFASQNTSSQLGVTALGFATTFVLSALIPAVRKEVSSFSGLLGAWRLSRQTL